MLRVSEIILLYVSRNWVVFLEVVRNHANVLSRKPSTSKWSSWAYSYVTWAYLDSWRQGSSSRKDWRSKEICRTRRTEQESQKDCLEIDKQCLWPKPNILGNIFFYLILYLQTESEFTVLHCDCTTEYPTSNSNRIIFYFRESKLEKKISFCNIYEKQKWAQEIKETRVTLTETTAPTLPITSLIR